MNLEALGQRTDKYFTKTRNVIKRFGDKEVRGGVFMRHDTICAIAKVFEFIDQTAPYIKFIPHYAEGAIVPAENVLFTIVGSMHDLVELETLILQRTGAACLSGYNAFKMSRIFPNVPFIDMHARHATGDDMTVACAYGASVGSRTAQLHGAKGFIGSSQDLTSHFYGAAGGLGTMPHALVGYAGSTLRAVEMFIEANPKDTQIVALVDYFGKEITDSIQVGKWFYGLYGGFSQWEYNPENDLSKQGKSLSVRLDTHGGRFAEGLDYEKSIQIVGDWLHVKGRWQIVRHVMGDDAYDVADDSIRDQVAKLLFGTGVSAANIINTRVKLNEAGLPQVKIVASSGFNLRKCKIMARAQVPVDVIGSGSFIPDKWSDCTATLDYGYYDREKSIKVGREWLLDQMK